MQLFSFYFLQLTSSQYSSMANFNFRLPCNVGLFISALGKGFKSSDAKVTFNLFFRDGVAYLTTIDGPGWLSIEIICDTISIWISNEFVGLSADGPGWFSSISKWSIGYRRLNKIAVFKNMYIKRLCASAREKSHTIYWWGRQSKRIYPDLLPLPLLPLGPPLITWSLKCCRGNRNKEGTWSITSN